MAEPFFMLQLKLAYGGEASYFNANVVGTRNIITACKKYGVRRLIYTST